MQPNSRPYRPPSTAQRTLRLALMNGGLLVAALLVFWLGSIVLHRPTGTEPRVATPAHMARGAAPGPLASGDYRLLLTDAVWVPQASVPRDAPLTFRARPDDVVDYLVVGVTVVNTGDAPLPFAFQGNDQDVRLLAVSTDPAPFARDPLTPAEAEVIAGRPGLRSGALAPGERRSGVLAFAVEPTRRAFALWAVPLYGPGVTPQQGPGTPALAMTFRPSR